jgi:hypothetical protein
MTVNPAATIPIARAFSMKAILGATDRPWQPELLEFLPGERSGGDLVMLRDLAEDPVAPFAGLVDIPRLQRKAQPLGGRIRLVNGEVAPPNPAVIPKVMVGVVLIDSKRQFGFPFHAFLCLVTGLKKRDFSDRSCF